MSENFKTMNLDRVSLKSNKQDNSVRGKLKIFIGYAPGVGKTYAMLNEANRRLKRGDNIVIGYLDTHGRKDIEEEIGELQIVPYKKIEYNDENFHEIDTEAIINMKPLYVLVDELAHTNAPGSKNKKRYEDVEDILSNGINVVTTLNIQHLESLNDVIKQITGIKVNETVPDRVIEEAEEVVVVDLTPSALQNRLKRGVIYNDEDIDRALKNFFRKGNLNALRELTLRQTAEEVDEDLEEYMKEHGIRDNWHTVERVMVCISSSPYAKKLIRRGARIARTYKCEWTVVSVNCTHIFAPKPTNKDNEIIESHVKLAKQLGANVVELTGKSISVALANFAEERHITQIVIGHSRRTKLQTLLRGSTINKLLKKISDVEVHVIPNNY